MDVTVKNGDTLCLGDGLQVRFMRTLRIPDDGRTYPLPPGLGTFPIRRVADYASRVPAEWLEHGGVFLPMYQREAMWLSFVGAPHALKIGIGKVCAVSGETWSEGLEGKPQRYVVTGTQPWLDGIASGKGTIRQFVAMPLGLGYTVEAQVTGKEEHGGVQLQAYPAKPGRIPPPPPMAAACYASAMPCAPMGAPSPARRSESSAGSMGLAAGGRMKQKVYPDPYGLDTWDTSVRSRVFVHLVNSELWREITGEEAPATPVTAKTYAQHGLPWFDLYDEAAPSIDPTSTLAGVKSVKALDAEKSTHALQDDAPVPVGPIAKIAHAMKQWIVKDGDW